MRLRECDFEVVHFLKNQGWVSSEQLAKRFFNSSRKTCFVRLRNLERIGVVERVSVSEFREKFWHEKPLLNFLCSINGRMDVYRLNEGFREALGQKWQRQSHDSMLAHQVLLTRVQERLESLFPEAHFVTDGIEGIRRSASRDLERLDALPDLVLQVNEKRIAVELERKARRGLGRLNFAYEDRFLELARDYDGVLYVLEREDQIIPLAQKANGLRRVGFCSILGFSEVIRAGREVVNVKEFFSECGA